MLHCSPTLNFESVIFKVISPMTVSRNPSSIVPSSIFFSVKCILSKFLIYFLLTASYFSSHHHQASVDNTLNSPCYFTTQPTSVLSPLCPSLTFLRQFSVATSKSHLSHTWSPSLFSVSCLGCAPPLSEWSSASFSTVEARSHTLTVTQCRYTFHFELRYVMEDKAVYSKETEVADRRQKGKDKRNVKK